MNANTYYCFAGNRGMQLWEKDSVKANKPLHETFLKTIMFLFGRTLLESLKTDNLPFSSQACPCTDGEID